ncbi:MAG: epoxyqueuosine reductase QueH [Desulfobacterota bacterium]|nr:epoxyqueuosine reductase QueH [Thermodesulfobacteriota bacterium]MDW8002546.1 epoxyqueuosine reductase QueH [Deltaproteobacteria bacterium]
MKDSLLLHVCCAPCLIYPLKVLREEGYEVTGFFFNPNIHPFSEFKKRLETLLSYSKVALFRLITDLSYDLESFLEGQLANKEKRCLYCYKIRMERTFEQALKDGFKNVTTTLLYSKYQKHETLKELCQELSKAYGINFVYFDFRTGWQMGLSESKALNMYRQNYCGCIFSEKERHGI